MSSISNYLKPAAGLWLSAVGAQQFNISTGSLSFLGMLAAGQILAHGLYPFAQSCLRSVLEFGSSELQWPLVDAHHRPIPQLTRRPALNLYQQQLTKIDLSKCPSVRFLDIDDNQLTELDLSKNGKLEGLTACNNQLASLKLSPSAPLKMLTASKNQLVHIDLPKQAPLKLLKLHQNRFVVAPDLSPHSDLVILIFSQNELIEPPDLSKKKKLKKVDLSHNKLTEFPDISGSPELEDLHLSSNKITEMGDVSENTKLKELDLSLNRLDRVHPSIYKLPRSCKVDLRNNRFSDEYIQGVQQKIQQARTENSDLGPDIQFDQQWPSGVAFWMQADDDEQKIASAQKLN